MITDALIIGAGTAGLTSAIRLAQEGLRVLVVATGEGALPLSSGTIDVLGYGPEPVTSPQEALPRFLQAHPGHPYWLSDRRELSESLAWFEQTAAPLGYTGDLLRNRWVPTALGGLRPTAALPRTMAAADLSDGGEVLVVGIGGFRDFHPKLVAENLTRARTPSKAGIVARSVQVDWPGSPDELAPFRLARRFEDADVRRQLVAQLRPGLGAARAVALPAVLGRERTAEVQDDLERRLERPVFEIPGLPPSLPGLRLLDRLRQALRDAGGRLLLGSKAVAAVRGGGSIRSVTVTQASRSVEVSPRVVVLASGGFATGGIIRGMDGALEEPIFGLPVAEAEEAGVPFDREYFSQHRVELAGVRTDDRGRPLDTAGAPFGDNLYAAGAVLAGARPWREKSGEGISLATAFHAAESILREGR